jgi:hypothetical protein
MIAPTRLIGAGDLGARSSWLIGSRRRTTERLLLSCASFARVSEHAFIVACKHAISWVIAPLEVRAVIPFDINHLSLAFLETATRSFYYVNTD